MNLHPFMHRAHMKRSRSNFSIAALIVLLAAAAGCAPRGGDNTYDTAKVGRGDLKQYVTASGTLSAVVSVDVGSQESGKVSTLKVDFNDHVRKGQLIAEID